jgi:hypothetical protein
MNELIHNRAANCIFDTLVDEIIAQDDDIQAMWLDMEAKTGMEVILNSITNETLNALLPELGLKNSTESIPDYQRIFELIYVQECCRLLAERQKDDSGP